MKSKTILLIFGILNFSISINAQNNNSYHQMSSKEGFYFLLKINQKNLTDKVLLEGNFVDRVNFRWFDVYVKLFDKTNYEYYSKDEFKWSDYSKRIVTEINNGIEYADFNKLYSYTRRKQATFGKYDFEKGGFPINIMGNTELFRYYMFNQDYLTLKIGTHFNKADIDYTLKMDTKTAEKLVETNGSDRKIDVKVIYNVVNRDMTNINKWDSKYLGIYVHKIILMNGATILGEITPNVDYYDKVNLVEDKSTAYYFKGKELFNSKTCTACHSSDGGGLVGPNLTDKNWILGGDYASVFNTISKGGRPGKGMVAWEKLISNEDREILTYYVLSLQGSTPSNSKVAEGELWENGVKLSTITQSNSSKKIILKPDIDRIKNDLLGNTIYSVENKNNWWRFDKLEEITYLNIIKTQENGNDYSYEIFMNLEDYKSKKKYTAHVIVKYILFGDKWVFLNIITISFQ